MADDPNDDGSRTEWVPLGKMILDDLDATMREVQQMARGYVRVPVPRPLNEDEAENHETRDGPSPVDKALGLLVSDHGMTVTEIAKRVGCDRSTLYRDPRFKSALEVLRDEQSRPRTMPKGEKSDGTIEAWR